MASTSASPRRFPGEKARTTSARTRRRRLSPAGHWVIPPSRQKRPNFRISSAAPFRPAGGPPHCKKQSPPVSRGETVGALLARDLGETSPTFGPFEGDH